MNMKKETVSGTQPVDWKGSGGAKSLTYEASGRSVLKHNIRLLNWMGLWDLSGSWTFWAFCRFTIVFCTFGLFMNIVAICLSDGSFDFVAMAFDTMLPMLSGMMQAVMFLRNRPAFDSLVKRVDAHVHHHRWVCDEDSEARSILQGARRKSLSIMLLTSTYYIVILTNWLTLPILEQEGGRRLPFIEYSWVDTSKPTTYAPYFFLQTFTTCQPTFLSFTIEFFFLSVMVHISAQFNILGVRLINLDRYGTVGNVQLKNKSSSHRNLEMIYEELGRCVQTHQELLSLVKSLDDLMSHFTMLQFVGGTFSVCVVLYLAADSGDLTTKLRGAGWLPGPGLQLFIYCWGAHEVSEKGAAVAQAAYSSPWVESPTPIRRAVGVVLARAQRPPVLTAGHVYTISRATFVSMVNAAYSYYTLLSQMHNR